MEGDIFTKEDLMQEVIDNGVMQGINEIIEIQKNMNMITSISGLNINNVNSVFSFGDTVSNITISPKTITIGKTDLTEDDLIKIKKSSIFNE